MNHETSPQLTRRVFGFSLMPALVRRRLFPKPEESFCGVDFRVMRYGFESSNRRFIVIHGDEDTARDVLTDYMNDHMGAAFLVTGKTRLVEVLGAKLDPNRMFSRVGAEKSLRGLNDGIADTKVAEVLAFLDKDRERLLKRLLPPPGGRIFALHNNRDYSVQDEIAASDRTSIRQPGTPRNFFLCTDPRDYEILAKSPFNVVLQSKADPDDGSLSRLAAKRGVRYINLECAIGDYEGQLQRVRWLEDRLE
jgi:hypothetical protein